MKKFVQISLSAIVSIVTVLLVSFSPFVLAADPIQTGADAARSSSQPTDIFGDSGIFTRVSNILLFIIGVLSVIMLIIGGLRYVISGGNASAVTAAKNTILYAIVGLVVAMLAYAIIHFVIGALTGGGAGGTNV